MNIDFLSHLQTLPAAQLQPIVGSVLHSAVVELLDWQVKPLAGGGEQLTRGGGIFRFVGSARVGGIIQPWSVVLKVAGGSGPYASDDPRYPEYWKRETEVFRAGTLSSLPPGVVAPRCYGVTQEVEREIWMWLEDIPHSGGTWTLDRYELAARHLGQFNGAYLMGYPLPPDTGWLLHGGRARGWLVTSEAMMDNLYNFLGSPLGQAWFQPGDRDYIARLFANRNTLLDALDRLPRCLCHHDAHGRNLLDRQTADGQVETVGIDWSYVGYGGVGQEIAMTTAVTLQWLDLKGDQAWELDEAVFTGYLAGLREAGWQGDPRLARLGYTATLALAEGVAWPAFMGVALSEPEGKEIMSTVVGHPFDEIMGQWRQIQPMFYALGDEALALLDDVPLQ